MCESPRVHELSRGRTHLTLKHLRLALLHLGLHGIHRSAERGSHRGVDLPRHPPASAMRWSIATHSATTIGVSEGNAETKGRLSMLESSLAVQDPSVPYVHSCSVSERLWEGTEKLK